MAIKDINDYIFVLRSPIDWFDGDNPLNKEVSRFLNEPRFTAKDLPVTYRMLNHWDVLGLLPSGLNSDGSWRKLSFLERVWIGVIMQMREFGVSLEKIAIAQKCVLQYSKKLKAYPYFEYYTARAISSTDDPYIVVLEDGTADIGTQEDIEFNKLLMNSKNMLLISLKVVLKQLGEDVVEPAPLVSLTTKESEIITALRTGQYDDINIKLKDGEIIETQNSRTYHGKPEIDEIYKNIEKKKEFAEVIIKFQKGVGEMVKVVKKKRTTKK